MDSKERAVWKVYLVTGLWEGPMCDRHFQLWLWADSHPLCQLVILPASSLATVPLYGLGSLSQSIIPRNKCISQQSFA